MPGLKFIALRDGRDLIWLRLAATDVVLFIEKQALVLCDE